MNAIEIRNVSKRFKERDKHFHALRNVSLDIRKGEIFGLLGPNGAGKTTLINIMINLLEPDEGSVRIFGKPPQEVLESISIVAPNSRFHWALNVGDVFSVFSEIYNIRKEEARKRTESLARFFSLERLMKRKFSSLSTGESMRLSLAKALLNHPKVLLLDEPTLGLDPEIAIRVREEILRINRKYRTTILLTSHYMHEVEMLADRIAFIRKGEIVDTGTVEKVKLKHFSDYELIVKVRKLSAAAPLRKKGFRIRGNILTKNIRIGDDVSEIISFVKSRGMIVTDIESRKPSLEDYFVKIAGER